MLKQLSDETLVALFRIAKPRGLWPFRDPKAMIALRAEMMGRGLL